MKMRESSQAVSSLWTVWLHWRAGFFFSLREHITVTDELLTRPVDPPEEMSSYPYHGHVCVCVCLHDPECVSWRMCVCVRPCNSVYVYVCHGLIPCCWQCWYTLASHRMHDGSL